MMKLYKYFSVDAGIAFLKEPAMRLSQNNSLNDPFEVLLTDADLEKIKEATKREISSEGKTYTVHREITSFINMSGILSFSLNKESMPMWGNYASDNKGIMVEFETDEDNPFSLFDIDMFNDDEAYKSKNVNYAYERFLENKINSLREDELNSLCDHYFFTKHSSWKYEKEYRFIMPYTNCNKVIAFGNNKNREFINKIGYKGNISEHITDLSKLFNFEIDFEKWTEAWRNYEIYKIMFFIKIKPENISKIYFGVNANDAELKKSIVTGAKFPTGYRGRFYNIVTQEFKNVYKCEIDKNKFKLTYKKI